MTLGKLTEVKAYEFTAHSKEVQMNDSAYLAYSLACAPVPHTIERVPGIQSRLWAACQHCRPELDSLCAALGGTPGPQRQSFKKTHLEVAQNVSYSSLVVTFFLSLVAFLLSDHALKMKSDSKDIRLSPDGPAA